MKIRAASRMKVLRIITRLNIGGPAIHTILLSSSLNKKDTYEDILICGKTAESEGNMRYLARDKGLEPIVIPDLRRTVSPVKDIKALANLYFIMKREKPDIIHTHTAKAGTLGRLAAILAGVPVKIHTFHGHIFHSYFNPLIVRLFLVIERVLANFTDKIIAVSPRQKRELTETFRVAPEDKFAVIPLGLELEPFFNSYKRRGVLRKEFGIEDECLLVGIVGRLVGIKNHRMFLDIAKRILEKERFVNVMFFVVGGGELKDMLERHARDVGVHNRVVFTGWRRDLDAVYADLDVVVLTSYNEGTPVGIIEAMAAKKVVVAADVGGISDLISDGHNGLLVDRSDLERFSDNIIGLLTDEKRRLELGINAHEFVKRIYSKERLVNDIEQLYRECWQRKSRGVARRRHERAES